MGRLLFFIALIALTVYLIKKIYLTDSGKEVSEAKPDDPRLMKKCELCDLHIPADQGITDTEGHFFCSEAHKESFGKG